MQIGDEEDYSRWKVDKSFRLRVVVFVIPGVVALLLVFFRIISPEYSTTLDLRVSIATVLMMLISAIGLLMLYLQTGFRRSSASDSNYVGHDHRLINIFKQLEDLKFREKHQYSELAKMMQDFDQRLQSVSSGPDMLSDQNRADLITTIKNRLEAESADQVLATIQSRVEERVVQESRSKNLERQFSGSLERLTREIAALSRRGNLNLVLGIMTTVVGLGILGYYVFYDQASGQNPWLFTSHFLPRLTLVIFIEIFAYFFLRLYKSSLIEIKYFQNEMTNLESRFIALVIALEVSEAPTLDSVIIELGKTERNHVLQKGQTTLRLERAKADKDILSDFVSKALALLGKHSS